VWGDVMGHDTTELFICLEGRGLWSYCSLHRLTQTLRVHSKQCPMTSQCEVDADRAGD
jgi:hypothetical protein